MEGPHEPGQLVPNIYILAQPMPNTKEWHASVQVNPDHRRFIVVKLVSALFPSSDPQAWQDERMHNLVACAKKSEADIYANATSKSEYYHLLADKIFKLQKEMEEKRKSRKRRWDGQPGQPGAPGPSGAGAA